MTRTLIVLLLALSAGTLPAQTVVEARTTKTSGLEFSLTNDGRFAFPFYIQSQQQPALVYPRGSKKQYIAGSGLWFGARKRQGATLNKLSFLTYNPNSGEGWAWPGEVSSDGRTYTGHLYGSADMSRSTGRPIVAGAPAPWPLWRIGEASVSMLDPGTFVRDTARRAIGPEYSSPAFVPGVTEQFVSRFTDTLLTRFEIGVNRADSLGFPLGLQFQQITYAWAPGPLGASAIVQYEIVNAGSDTLLECYIGQASDLDIGSRVDNDYVTWYAADPSLDAVVGASPSDGGGITSILMTTLETPTVDPVTRLISNGMRANRGRQVGLTGVNRYTILTEPKIPGARYDSMAVMRMDVNTATGDIRAVLSSGPFTLRPGDTVHFAIAYSVLDVVNPLDPSYLGALQSRVQLLRSTYYQTAASEVAMANALPAAKEIEAIPNPTAERTMIHARIPGVREAEISVIDPMGHVVLSGSAAAADGEIRETIDLSSLARGVYLVRVRGGGTVTTVKVEKSAP